MRMRNALTLTLGEVQQLLRVKDSRIASLEPELHRLKNPRVHDVTDLYESEESATDPQLEPKIG